MNIKSKEEIIKDIRDLVNSEGYIYALCLILFEDFHVNLNTIHEVDHKAKLSIKEITFLIGFLVQDEINLTPPKSPECLFKLKSNTYRLMEELHLSYIKPFIDNYSDISQQLQVGASMESNNSFENRLNFWVKGGGMVEPMFYSGDGVYDFQYLEYLDKKYCYDQEWLLKNKRFEIDKTIEQIKLIKEILQTKSQKVNLIGIRERVPEFYEDLKKSTKGKLREEEMKEQMESLLISVELYQYINIFPPTSSLKDVQNIGELRQRDWDIFYKNLLDLFIIKKNQINKIDSFLDNFSFIPSKNNNKGYIGFGSFNILNSKPLIEIDKDSYFVPINYLVSEAVYETPFYWMMEDESYRDKLGMNRGQTGEEMTYSLLSKVFGEANTYKSVTVEIQKGYEATDIDVLCILGNKALCVQIKSKKLTLLSKRGDNNQLNKDFKGAIQDAYDQGLISRLHLLDKKASFYKEDNTELMLTESIDEVFILGITTENYPSLAHQAHVMLRKEENEPYPLFLTIFDLELLVHYLNKPHDFLYYVRQRIRLMDYFKADEEMVYLGYHLQHKLWKLEKADYVTIDSDYGYLIDRNYYPLKAGFSHFVSNNDPIKNRWKDENFDLLYDELCKFKTPKTVDIIFNLLDWSGKGRSDLASYIIETRHKTLSDQETHSITTSTSDEDLPGFGVAYISLGTNDLIELREMVLLLSKARKYRNKCDSWLGIGSILDSGNLIDFMCYNDTEWKYNENLENIAKTVLDNNSNKKLILLDGRRKIGRNDLCPCGSGKKYKKCCLK